MTTIADIPGPVFTELAGVPVHYSRPPVAPYGERGSPRRCGPVQPAFRSALEAWMLDLGSLCPWGFPELLVTGGVTGDGHGRHGEGRAIDLDSLWWPGRPPLVAINAPRTQALYLAVEATMRLHFGVVLDWWYNADHRDHWHVDDGSPAGWQVTRSHVVFLQAALNLLRPSGPLLAVDGLWGARTAAAVGEVLGSMSAGPLPAAWPVVLRAVARRGFEAAG